MSMPPFNPPTGTPPPLPGTTSPPPGTPTPPLPGSQPQALSAKQIADIEAEWLALRDYSLRTLAEAVLFVNAHPELVIWAREQTARFNPTPGKLP